MQEDLFKELSEAYSVLSDQKKRARYDHLVMGDSVTSSAFKNQDSYDYWKNRSEEAQKKRKRTTDEGEDYRERVAEKMRGYRDYADFVHAYEKHRSEHAERTSMRTEGFEEARQKHPQNYDHYLFVEKEFEDRYYSYRSGFVDEYWDTKENHAYYSQPLSRRAALHLKKVWTFYSSFSALWALIGVLIVLNARSTARKTHASSFLSVDGTGKS